MKWIKKGQIYKPALQPTPYLLSEDVIRMFVGIRDKQGISRIHYADLDSNNPSKILKVSKNPILDIGEVGCFDDNGVVPCAVIEYDNRLYMYYAGYQLGTRVRMLIFSGLAVSDDKGETFERCSKIPIMDRTTEETLFRVIHSIMFKDGVFKTWYGGGSYFKQGKHKTLPLYDIRYGETSNLKEFKFKPNTIIPTSEDEYRVGRPYVIEDEGVYRMFFCAGSEKLTYKLAYAESSDGNNWIRKDEELNLELSYSGWDSEMMAYPALVKCKTKVYLFYNGNGYDQEGFGYAELIDEL